MVSKFFVPCIWASLRPITVFVQALFKLKEAGLRADPRLLEKALDAIGEKRH